MQGSGVLLEGAHRIHCLVSKGQLNIETAYLIEAMAESCEAVHLSRPLGL